MVCQQGIVRRRDYPLDRLCYVGKRGMGALEFEPSSPINGMNESSVLHIEELTELAKSVFTDRMAFQVQLRQKEETFWIY